MNITIVGAGNVGTQFAVHCAAKGHQVIIYSKNYKKISKEISLINEDTNQTIKVNIKEATDNPKTAFENADLIFITVPAFMMKETAEIIKPHVKENAIIGLVPGTGGCEFPFGGLKNCVIFGLQRVPSVARLREYGKIACAKGYRNELFVAAIPKSKSSFCAEIVENIFDIKCSVLPDFLNLTLTPSNSLIHPSRLYSLFKDYYSGKIYKKIPLFYDEWDIETSKLLLNCDDEVQQLCKRLIGFDLSGVKSLKLHYESDTAEKLTEKILSIKGFHGLTTPAIQCENGYIPDFNSRYFTADFPFTLAVIKKISNLLTPPPEMKNIDMLLNWYSKLNPDSKMFNFKDFNISTLDDLKNFYN